MNLYQKIDKYLSKQNIKRWQVQIRYKGLYNNFVIIPASDEFDYLPSLLKSLESNQREYLAKTLILVVVNNSENASSEVKLNNQKLLEFLDEKISDTSSLLNLGYIDAASKGCELDDKLAGVGFARKLGIDSCLKLLDYANNERKIFISLDADCTVSENYLSKIIHHFNKHQSNAAVIRYEHILPENIAEREAIVNYELFLRYYVLGLRFAGSPYAFHTIGSAFACSVESYINVGGMNSKKGGEDFYFLQKLAKIFNIDYIKDATVYPSARVSNRVPFGTGPRVGKFIENNNEFYSIYSPKIFILLKAWLKQFMASESLTQHQLVKEFIKNSEKLNPNLKSYLESINFEKDWAKIIAHSKKTKQINNQKKIWFDGFKTLKFIHYFRDNVYPNEPMFDSLNNILNLSGIDNKICIENGIPSLDVQEEYLKLFRKIT